MLQNKVKILVVLVVVLVIGLVFVLFRQKLSSMFNNNDYSVVYLTTGEVYVGKLSTFPNFQLTNAYILQVTKDVADPTKNNFQLNPIKEALWAPKSLHLVKDNIIFYGPLLPNSKIAETIATQGK